MKEWKVRIGLLAAAGLASVWFARSASGQDPIVVGDDTSGEIAEMPMQVSTGGLTHEEYLVRQEQLNSWLTAEAPKGVLNAPISIQLTPEEVNAVDNPLPVNGAPLQIGIVKPVTAKVQLAGLSRGQLPKNSQRLSGGVVDRTKDSGLVWAMSIVSQGAGAVRAHITNFSLPANAELYFYSPLGEAFGPYTDRGPDGNGEFWTESVFGSQGVLQLRFNAPVVQTDLRSASLSVTEIGHISPRFTDQFMQATAAGFCGNVSCIVDATCYNNTPADPAKLAAAKMEWIAGAYIYTCTGGLIADNNPAQSNYFLTANHCISKSTTAKNVQFYWRFATSTCNGACPSNSGWPYKTTGAAVRATNRRGDFTLMQLNANPPSGSVFLGWTNAPIANTNGAHLYRISNPNFGPQVYSAHDVSTSAPTCSGWPRGERIYSKDITGATDGGSSGSPVLNASGQIVGQLSGACGTNPSDPCASTANATVDGAFAYYYSSVQPYLAP